MAPKKLTVDELVQALLVDRDHPAYTLFLGAGASVSSRVPTADGLILNLLEDAYSLANDRALPRDRFEREKRVRRWAEAKLSWYNPRSPRKSLYAQVMENVLKIPAARADFIQRALRTAHLSQGYRDLGYLVQRRVFTTIWTTNFDDLIQRCTQHLPTPIKIINDDELFSQMNVSDFEAQLAMLHGDFWHGDLANTLEELGKMRQHRYDALARGLRTHGVVVLGYGGQDVNLMTALRETAERSQISRHGVVWCMRRSSAQSSLLDRFLQACGDLGFVVEIDDFDSLMHRVRDVLERTKRLQSSSAIADSRSLWDTVALFSTVSDGFLIPKRRLRKQLMFQSLLTLCRLAQSDRAVLVGRVRGRRSWCLTASCDVARNSVIHGWEGRTLHVAALTKRLNNREYLSFSKPPAGIPKALSYGQKTQVFGAKSKNSLIGFVLLFGEVDIEDPKPLRAATQMLVMLAAG